MSLRVSASTDKITRTAALPLYSAATMAGWFKRVGAGGGAREHIMMFRQSSPIATVYLTFIPASNNIQLGTPNTRQVALSATPADNVWFYAAVRSGGDQSGDATAVWFNADGTVGGTATNALDYDSLAPVFDSMGFVCHPTATTEPFNGLGAYGRVWDAVLTNGELQLELASPTPVRIANLNTAFNEDSVTDVSGNGRDWTPTGVDVETGDNPTFASLSSYIPLAAVQSGRRFR